jgi:chitinase
MLVEIMNYDVWGSWSPTVGPNAPLNDSCAPVQAGSAVSAVQAWSNSGMHPNQIVLGVPAYGHSFSVSTSAALSGSTLVPYPTFDKANQPAGDSWDSPAGPDQCGNEQLAGGIFDFWGLVDGGFLTTNGTAAPGIDYRFDSCSQTVRVTLLGDLASR